MGKGTVSAWPILQWEEYQTWRSKSWTWGHTRIWVFKKCWACGKLIRPGRVWKHDSSRHYQHEHCVFLSDLII